MDLEDETDADDVIDQAKAYIGYMPPPEIDRRQKLAACLLLAAIDPPVPAAVAAYQLIEAARVCPGVTLDELPGLWPGSRRDFLARAGALIEEMLVEISE
jgi:hypothetical protein